MIIPVTRQELKAVLMDPKAPGVKEPYFIIKGEVGQEVTILTPGKNGNEYNKTYGFFSAYPGAQMLHVLYGQGVAVLQRPGFEGEVKEVRVVSLRAGMNLEVPAGYGHCLVNVGKTYLAVLDNFPLPQRYRDPGPVAGKRGLAYFVVDKKGDVGFEPNPNYKLHPQISTT